MKRSYTHEQVPNPLEVLRKAGYSFFRDPKTHEDSFVIQLAPPAFYPRLHLYLEQDANNVTFNLHIDQKKPTYGDGTAHSGEYDGPVVEKEMQRLDGWARSVKMHEQDDVHDSADEQDITRQRGYGDRFARWLKRLLRGHGNRFER